MTDPDDSRITTVVDWPAQQRVFARDAGMLLDIYVHDTTLSDWTNFVRFVAREHGAHPVPDVLARFDAEELGPSMVFRVGGIELTCHFFLANEIEVSLDPESVTASTLPSLFAFLIDVAELAGKPASMTPENQAQIVLFRYDPADRLVRWFPR